LPRVRLATVGGAELFTRFCASCHGQSGRGDGDVVAQREARELITKLVEHVRSLRADSKRGQ